MNELLLSTSDAAILIPEEYTGTEKDLVRVVEQSWTETFPALFQPKHLGPLASIYYSGEKGSTPVYPRGVEVPECADRTIKPGMIYLHKKGWSTPLDKKTLRLLTDEQVGRLNNPQRYVMVGPTRILPGGIQEYELYRKKP